MAKNSVNFIEISSKLDSFALSNLNVFLI